LHSKKTPVIGRLSGVFYSVYKLLQATMRFSGVEETYVAKA